MDKNMVSIPEEGSVYKSLFLSIEKLQHNKL